VNEQAHQRRSWLGLLCALAVDNFGSGLFLPLSLVYATRVVGLSLGSAGTVVSAGLVVGLFVPPVAGPLVDRLGPRAVVTTAQGIQALGALAYLTARGPAGVFAGALLLAAGSQTFYCSLFALIADVSPSGSKDRSYALVNAVRGAAFGFGALAAAGLVTTANRTGYRVAVGVDAVSFLVCALVLARWVEAAHVRHPAPAAPGAGAASAWRDPPFLALTLVTMLSALAVDFFLVGMPVYVLDELHGQSWLPGIILALLTAIGAGAAVIAMRVVNRLARTTSMAVRSVLYVVWGAASLGAAALPSGLRAPYLLTTTLLLAAGSLLGPVANALAEAAAPRAVRGRYLATFQYAFTVAGVLTPAIVALFTYAIWLPWLVVCAASAGAVGGSVWLAGRLPPAAVRPHQGSVALSRV
jgi:MFS family permease